MEPSVKRPDFRKVTELAGEPVSKEQLRRVFTRYHWASEYCVGKDVVEVACGTGQGLGYLGSRARSIVGGDISPEMVQIAKEHYNGRIEIREMDAMKMPFADQSIDVIVIFEAIYYLPSFETFVKECRRILRPDGWLLISSANKDISEFNPSPFAFRYYGIQELDHVLRLHGYRCQFWGDTPINTVSWRQKILRPAKRIAVRLNLIPQTMEAKKLLKRLVFGKLVPMPREVTADMLEVLPLNPIAPTGSDRIHKVIYCAAQIT